MYTKRHKDIADNKNPEQCQVAQLNNNKLADCNCMLI